MNNYDQVTSDTNKKGSTIIGTLHNAFNNENHEYIAKLDELTKQWPKGQIDPWPEILFKKKTSFVTGIKATTVSSILMNAKNPRSK